MWHTLAQIWLEFFDPRVVVIATVSTIDIKTLVSPRNFCLVSIISFEQLGDGDDSKQVLQENSKLSNVGKRHEPWMSMMAGPALRNHRV